MTASPAYHDSTQQVIRHHGVVVPPGKSLGKSLLWLLGGLAFLALGAVFPVHYTIFALAPVLIGVFGVYERFKSHPSVTVHPNELRIVLRGQARTVAWTEIRGTAASHSIHGRDPKHQVERRTFEIWLRDGSRFRFDAWLEDLSAFVSHVERATHDLLLGQLTEALRRTSRSRWASCTSPVIGFDPGSTSTSTGRRFARCASLLPTSSCSCMTGSPIHSSALPR
jgi:hypothetical protein